LIVNEDWIRGEKNMGNKLAIITLCVCIFFIPGCFGRTKTPYITEQFAFEYNPTAFKSTDQIDGSVKIERFSVNQLYNSQAMVFRAQPYKLSVYNYNRWRTSPGDMVCDFLTRDFRTSNVFAAVFSYRDTEEARFIVEGGVEEFLESFEKDTWNAVLKINVSFIDDSQKEITKRVLFQKRYFYKEKMKEHSPDEFARGMSTNMQRFSEQLISDVAIESIKTMKKKMD